MALIHDELVGLFKDMFAGRDLTPIPTPAEFAAGARRPGKGVAIRAGRCIGYDPARIPASQNWPLELGSQLLACCATISVEKSTLPENSEMAYVIAEPCIGTKDTACVDACPVDCIHPKKDEDGHAEADQLFIDPVECIDCGACVPACPVSAIFAQDDLPEKWAHFTEKNAAHFGR